MKKIIIICAIMVVALSSMVSCGDTGKTAIAEPPINIAPIVTKSPPDYTVDINRVVKGGYALFGTIDVNNYRLGVTVDRNTIGYQPFYIVNRIGEVKETKQITTGDSETTADIPIKNLLHNGELSSVIGVDSDLKSDKLVVIGYVAATNSLTITGFDENKSRIVVIRYVPDTVYRVTLDNDKNAGNELTQYCTLESGRITVAPDSYEPINYSFMVPEDIVVPTSFTIWVYTESTYVTGVGVEYNIGYYAPIKITMAE